MRVQSPRLSLSALRRDIIGRDLVFRTPFGLRHLMYADYTASGRALRSVEDAILRIERSYANTHTEDDYSGRTMTRLYHEAEKRIKDHVNAGPGGKIFPVGSGSTGALKKLQEILGVYLPPVTRERIEGICRAAGDAGWDPAPALKAARPVVFIGPYEHHTNELMWREAFVDVVVVSLGPDGALDLADLERKVSDPGSKDRTRYGSFSAGSNITGIRTPVYEVARICRRHGASVFFDFAAVAPYIPIDMNRTVDCAFDAIFFSPHKFLGGPGSCGILVMNERLYRADLPPTTAGGGTVVYVGPKGHDYAVDIETRETAGTPPILQTIKAALAMDVKAAVGVPVIEKIEAALLARFLAGIRRIPGLRLVGPEGAEGRTPIVSFNIDHRGRILHPKFVTRLLNDLFGIQSRAGCSCAGPYGHLLLGIDESTSLRYREAIVCGREGLKPGWVRINLHFTFTRRDVDFLVRAVDFVARNGELFLRRYAFEERTGGWEPIGFQEEVPAQDVLSGVSGRRLPASGLEKARASYFRAARREADKLRKLGAPRFRDDGPDAALRYFFVAENGIAF